MFFFYIENAAFDVTVLFSRRKQSFERFSSRSIVDFEDNETPEPTFYICYDIFNDFFPYIMFQSKTLLRCTLLHNWYTHKQ
jgi:hypothetical protein